MEEKILNILEDYSIKKRMFDKKAIKYIVESNRKQECLDKFLKRG